MAFETGDQRLARGESCRRLPHGWPNLSQRASINWTNLLYNGLPFPGQVHFSLQSIPSVHLLSFAAPVELCSLPLAISFHNITIAHIPTH
jgi:hypothetical protein